MSATDVVLDGQRVPVIHGIELLRMPLPFALNHVNCWWLHSDDGYAVIDTGIASKRQRTCWTSLFQAAGAPPAELLVTHFHPDHAGLAGWFAEQGAPVTGSRIDTQMLDEVYSIDDADYGNHTADWYSRNGMPAEAIEKARAFGNGFRRIVAAPPPAASWRLLGAGDEWSFGRFRFNVRIGRGHAPEMLLLHDPVAKVLIVADQVLPSITPNVSLMARVRDDNPLGSYLASLEELRDICDDTLVLPSHGRPFKGLVSRIDELVQHHQERLAAVRAACQTPHTAVELFPVLFNRVLDRQQTSFALGEALSHLRWLEHAGQVCLQNDAVVERYCSV